MAIRYGLVAKSYKNNILLSLGEFYMGIKSKKELYSDLAYLTPFMYNRKTAVKITNKADIDSFREKYKISRTIKLLTDTNLDKIIFTTPRLYNITEKKFLSGLPTRKKFSLKKQTHVCLIFDCLDPCRRNMLLEYSLQYGYKFIVFSHTQRLYLRLCGVPFSCVNVIKNILEFLVNNTDIDIGLCCLPEDSGELLVLLKFWRRSGYNINNKYEMFIPFF